jgi:hypothetical protein
MVEISVIFVITNILHHKTSPRENFLVFRVQCQPLMTDDDVLIDNKLDTDVK